MSIKDMKPEVREQWVKALRSGEFEQTTGCLSKVDPDSEEQGRGYCCLGVLTELAIRDGVPVAWADDTHAEGQYVVSGYTEGYGEWSEDSYLHPAVQAWAGIDDHNPILIEAHGTTASELNDDGTTFEEIATAIQTGALP